MNITLEHIEPIEKAFERLRNAPLEAAEKEQIFIYKDAAIRLCDFDPAELNLISLYVIKERVEFQIELRDFLLSRYQVDTFALSAILHLKTEEGTIAMAPPFVEFYKEKVSILPHSKKDRTPPEYSNISIPILKDGIHRAYAALEKNSLLRCITVHGALTEYPPYAYPNEWFQVEECDAVPENKKFYRRKNPYTFMRPLKALRQIGNEPIAPEWNRKK